MNPDHIKFLRCPKSTNALELLNEKMIEGRVESGTLRDPVSNNTYEIKNFIPRFVPIENYSTGFGYQWNLHKRTQYDEVSKFNMSQKRFEEASKWGNNLRGETILEIGSGSGRFTRHAIETGAMVISLDYSNAVEANYHSNGHESNILILQASVYEMPFEKNYFDKAFCFGVLQHTPNPKESFLMIPKYLKPGGKIATDIYVKDLTHWFLQPKYWIRPFTKGGNSEKLYKRVKAYIDFIWPLARLIRKIPKIGAVINWKLLVADYSRELKGADDSLLKEWAYLDSFDMLSPMFDYPQTVSTFRKWHEEAGLKNIEVHRGYNGVEGRGQK